MWKVWPVGRGFTQVRGRVPRRVGSLWGGVQILNPELTFEKIGETRLVSHSTNPPLEPTVLWFLVDVRWPNHSPWFQNTSSSPPESPLWLCLPQMLHVPPCTLSRVQGHPLVTFHALVLLKGVSWHHRCLSTTRCWTLDYLQLLAVTDSAAADTPGF